MEDSPYIGRIVVLLTPVFAGLAGWIATRAAEVLPGTPALDSGEITALFVAGALSATGAVVKWLDNRGKHEQQQANAAAVVEELGRPPLEGRPDA